MFLLVFSRKGCVELYYLFFKCMTEFYSETIWATKFLFGRLLTMNSIFKIDTEAFRVSNSPV